MAAPRKIFTLVMDDEHVRILDACAENERLTKSDVLRRALRRFAKQTGALKALEDKPKLALASGG